MSTNKLYDNCELYTNDAKHFIGYCPKKRMEWYIAKGLATVINDKAIAINFEPKMRNGDSFEEMTIRKENECVVCGVRNDTNNDVLNNTINLRKFHTIPLEFKKKFPIEYKSHISNDIVLLCDEHMNEANYIIKSFRDDLLNAYNIKENDFIDVHKRRLILEANYIMNGKKPKLILQKMMKLEHEPTENEIIDLANQTYVKLINGCSSVSEYIVNKYIDKNKLDEFISMWKDNYIQNMQPNYLPNSFTKK